MSDVTRHGFAELDGLVASPKQWSMNATIRPSTLVDELLSFEAAAGIESDAVGVLNDENDLIVRTRSGRRFNSQTRTASRARRRTDVAL